METVFLITAGLGGSILLLQALASAIGVGLDADHDLGHEHSGHGSHDNGFFGMLTLRSVAAAICFFGLAGLSAASYGVPLPGTIAAATLGGVVALYSVASIMSLFQKLKDDGTANLENALGTIGTVYLRIPGSVVPGKVTLHIHNRTVECEAFAECEIGTGRTVRVIALRGDAVEVEPHTETIPMETV